MDRPLDPDEFWSVIGSVAFLSFLFGLVAGNYFSRRAPMVYAGQIESLADNGDGTIELCVAGDELFSRRVPGTALKLEGRPATVQEVMAWHAQARGGAYARMVTDRAPRPFDQGVCAEFSSNPIPE